jgi:threonyl-tRNA synthetase
VPFELIVTFPLLCTPTQDGYELLYTPHMANLGLWKTSGHFDFYKENMFQAMEVENEEYQIKPMNCPFHCLIYKVCYDVS